MDMDQQGPPRTGKSESAKPKYRPQQSCLRCRERKVKCDRAKPCGACCARGLESQCQYATNNEERFQISQAETIENLRRQVRELKKLLGEVDQSAQSSNEMDCGDGPFTTSGQRFNLNPGSNAPASSSGPQELILRPRLNDPTLMPADPFQHGWSTGSSPIEFTSDVHSTGSPSTVASSPGDLNLQYNCQFSEPQTMPTYAGPVLLATPYQPIADANSNALPGPDSDFWKGRTILLQEIFDTISACDDSRVLPLIHIIRTSPTPEDAFMSIYQNIH